MKRLAVLTAAALMLLAPAVSGAQESEDTPTGGAWIDCNLVGITAYRNRIGVVCTPLSGAPSQFAVEMTNPLADAVLRLAQQSLTLKRPLRVLYVVAPEGNPAGCDPKTCRGIVGVEAR